jgi:hypothetical protein
MLIVNRLPEESFLKELIMGKNNDKPPLPNNVFYLEVYYKDFVHRDVDEDEVNPRWGPFTDEVDAIEVLTSLAMRDDIYKVLLIKSTRAYTPNTLTKN